MFTYADQLVPKFTFSNKVINMLNTLLSETTCMGL